MPKFIEKRILYINDILTPDGKTFGYDFRPRLWKVSLTKKLDIKRVKQPVLECILKAPKVVAICLSNYEECSYI